MQQRGYCGWQHPRYAQGDQRQVEGHDKPVAAVDPIHQRFTELTQRHQLKEILRGNGDVGDLPGDGRAGGDGDARVRLRQSRGVVDAVTDHDDRVSGGTLPADYEALLALPGVGEYTAGAVASIGFGLCVPAVDGNVMRVAARLNDDFTPITDAKQKKRTTGHFSEITPEDRPGDFNQSLMELGAMVCLPNGAPKCEVCPLFDQCLAGQHQTWTEYPFKKSAKPRRIEDRTVLLFLDGTHTAVRKRPKKGLLAGLYEFPNFDGVLSEQEALEEAEKFGVTPLHIQALPPYKHIFSHVEWHITGYAIKIAGNDVEQEGEEKAGLIFADAKTAAERYAIPSAFAEYAKYTDLERA